MTKKDKQYTIYIRSTKESIPVSKEEFDAYYHDINIYRIRQQRHGRCVCPASKRLTCDMDCMACPFHRMGDMRSLDYTETDNEGNETAWVDKIPDDSPLLEDIIIEASEMKALYARLTELMPEAVKIGEMRLEGLSEDAIGERMLCEVAWIMASHRKLYLSGWYWKVKQRKGAKRATIALARKILSIIYTIDRKSVV